MNALARLRTSRIARNTSVLAFAQITARVMTFFYIAALARYVGAEGMGKISTATALTSMVVLMVGPGLSTLLIRDVAADTGKVTSYIHHILFLKAVFALPFMLVTALIATGVGYSTDTTLIIYLYMVVFLLDSINEVLAAVFHAFQHMEYDAGSQLVQALVNVSLSLLGIFLQWPLLAIVLVSVVAQGCRFLPMLVLARGYVVRLRPAIQVGTARTLFVASLPFGAFAILTVVRSQLGTFVLSLHYAEAVVGIYSAATTLISILLLVPTAFSTAIFPVFSSLYAHSKHDLQRFYQVCYKFLLVIGFPLAVGTILIGAEVVELIYGEDFTGTAPVLSILALFLFTLVGYSNGPLLNATGKQLFFAWTEGGAVLANALLSFLLIPRWGPLGAALAFLLPGTGTFLVHSLACHRLFGLALPWGTMVKVGLAAAAMGLAVSLTLSAGLPWLIAALTVAPGVYGLSIYLLGLVDRDELRLLAGGVSAPPQAAPETLV